MTDKPGHQANDWAGSVGAFAVAWGVPSVAVVGGAFLDVLPRTAIWSVALIWMGTACLMNARRCGRIHCRYTGPYYLALIVPVVLLGSGQLPFGDVAWWVVGGLILFGGKIIWWATETVWGKYRSLPDGPA